MKGNYVRGFKEALEWALYMANETKTLEELVLKMAAKYEVMMLHHILNIDEEFHVSKETESAILNTQQ
jgi:hypothetical protein